MPRLSPIAMMIAPVLLAACHSSKDARNLDSLDNQLTGANAADPALQDALNDQIMVDPALAQQSNADAVRPPARPYSAEVPPTDVATAAGGIGSLRHAPAPRSDSGCPACKSAGGALTLGELASRQKGPHIGSCSADVQYSASWAARLGDLPIYPSGHVSEAAGADHDGCALRIVSFTTTAPAARVIDYYYTQATTAGYDADQQSDGRERVLGGTRARDGGAYVVFVNPGDGGGSAVDLVVNNGH